MKYHYHMYQSFVPHDSYIVSMTTIPSRVKLLPVCLTSIQKQTVPPSKIYLHIPLHSSKGEYDWNELNNIVQEFSPMVHLNIIDTDYGPITKLLPVLKLNISSENIVLVDDDVVYSPDIMHILLQGHHLQAVGFRGFSDDFKYITNVKKPTEVFYLETYHGVLYKRHLFTDTIFSFFENTIHHQPECKYTDDLVIGAYIRRNREKLWVIETLYAFVEHDAKDTEELRTNNLKNYNKTCASFLQ